MNYKIPDGISDIGYCIACSAGFLVLAAVASSPVGKVVGPASLLQTMALYVYGTVITTAILWVLSRNFWESLGAGLIWPIMILIGIYQTVSR